MQRFKNIIVAYDLVPGCDETLQRAVELAIRNDAKLTLLSAVNPVSNEKKAVAERDSLLARVLAGIKLPKAKKAHLVRQGPPAQQIVEQAHAIGADLIVTSDMSSGYYTQMFGLDLTTDLLRNANCPVWVVRSNDQTAYRRIIAAVNAGKKEAHKCPANRRILEIASSLAILEKADLHIVYAWDFIDKEREMMASEMPRSKYMEHCELARLKNLDHIETLTHQVLDHPPIFKAVPLRGQVGDSVIDYVDQQGADLLVADGIFDSPILSALTQGTSMQLLRQSSCSILFARPVPEARSAPMTDAA